MVTWSLLPLLFHVKGVFTSFTHFLLSCLQSFIKNWSKRLFFFSWLLIHECHWRDQSSFITGGRGEEDFEWEHMVFREGTEESQSSPTGKLYHYKILRTHLSSRWIMWLKLLNCISIQLLVSRQYYKCKDALQTTGRQYCLRTENNRFVLFMVSSSTLATCSCKVPLYVDVFHQKLKIYKAVP